MSLAFEGRMGELPVEYSRGYGRNYCQSPEADGKNHIPFMPFDDLICSFHFLLFPPVMKVSPHYSGWCWIESGSLQPWPAQVELLCTHCFPPPPQERSPLSTSSVEEVTSARHLSLMQCCLGGVRAVVEYLLLLSIITHHFSAPLATGISPQANWISINSVSPQVMEVQPQYSLTHTVNQQMIDWKWKKH